MVVIVLSNTLYSVSVLSRMSVDIKEEKEDDLGWFVALMTYYSYAVLIMVYIHQYYIILYLYYSNTTSILHLYYIYIISKLHQILIIMLLY